MHLNGAEQIYSIICYLKWVLKKKGMKLHNVV